MLSNANPKVKPGELSLAEKRALKQARKEQGITAKVRATKHVHLVKAETMEKDQVRVRDQRCRWPFCPCQDKPFAPESQLEVSHCVQHKGMGGDPQMIRTRREQMILVCQWQHTGPFGIDAGRAEVRPLTERGTDGPCEFFKQEANESGRWYSCGITYPPEPSA